MLAGYGMKLSRLDLPPVWLCGCMVLAWVTTIDNAPLGSTALWLGIALIALGVLLAVWAALAFWSARTTIIPREEPSALVETGPYRFSRNPIYIADLLILAGWCLAIGTILGLALLAPFGLLLHRRFILPEEATLVRHLGQPYLDYRARVRRWL